MLPVKWDPKYPLPRAAARHKWDCMCDETAHSLAQIGTYYVPGTGLRFWENYVMACVSPTVLSGTSPTFLAGVFQEPWGEAGICSGSCSQSGGAQSPTSAPQASPVACSGRRAVLAGRGRGIGLTPLLGPPLSLPGFLRLDGSEVASGFLFLSSSGLA